MTWWTIRGLYTGLAPFTAAISCRTSQDDHCFIKWAPWEPRRHELWRIFRGKDYRCGYKYIWDTPNLTEQSGYGDTEFHLFVLKDLTPATDYWGYIFAPDGPYGQEIQGPLMHWKTPAVVIPPEITTDPLPIDIANPVFRCGNRYTFWANGTWYAHVPSIFSLTVWKLIAGTFVRQDHAHEPVAPAGIIADADSRMDPWLTTIHCSYFCLVAFPGPNHLRYATFDLTTDRWLLDEHICYPTRKVSTQADTSLALDSWGRPHIVFTHYTNALPMIAYTRKDYSGWAAPTPAMDIPGKIVGFPSFAISPLNNTQWLIAVMNTYECYYAERPYGQYAFDTPVQFQTGINLSYHSAAAPSDGLDIAQVQPDWRVDSWRFDGIMWHASDLSQPISHYANVIATPHFRTGPLLAFRDDDNHLAYVWRDWDFTWQPQVQLAPDALILLTAHFATPDVVSCLYTRPLLVRCWFFAFHAPWH